LLTELAKRGVFYMTTASFYNIAKGIHYIFPNLFKFNASMQAAHTITLEASYLIWNSFYALGYSSIVLCLAALLFKKKDFM